MYTLAGIRLTEFAWWPGVEVLPDRCAGEQIAGDGQARRQRSSLSRHLRSNVYLNCRTYSLSRRL